VDAPFGSLSAGSLTVPADYVGNSLGLTGYTALYFLNSAANNAPWQVSYSFSAAFSVGSGDSSALFTTGADEVNFNALTTSQVQAITADAGLDRYNTYVGARLI
jgi:hypothetical protein